ncbi:hypothetical protein ACJW30_01G228900 [Castanea mollissima]
MPNGSQNFSSPLKDVEESQKGQRVQGLREVKHYLNKYGYLNYEDSNNFEDDEFDEALEFAIKKYQTYFHLNVTGKLDTDTIKEMSLPRCGVPDIINGSLTQPEFAFMPGVPKWPYYMRNLKYAFESTATPNLKLYEIKAGCSYGFGQWARFSDFKFEFTDNVRDADMIIGFHRGDHGDGMPFDGRGGELAHAMPPTNGRLHFDADENWTIGANVGPNQVDFMGVSLHEVGHLLGLDHSRIESSIMYPRIVEGVKKRGLSSDDMEGLLSLYSS